MRAWVSVNIILYYMYMYIRTSASTAAKHVFLNWSNVPSDLTLSRTASADGSGLSRASICHRYAVVLYVHVRIYAESGVLKFGASGVNMHVTPESHY